MFRSERFAGIMGVLFMAVFVSLTLTMPVDAACTPGPPPLDHIVTCTGDHVGVYDAGGAQQVNVESGATVTPAIINLEESSIAVKEDATITGDDDNLSTVHGTGNVQVINDGTIEHTNNEDSGFAIELLASVPDQQLG